MKSKLMLSMLALFFSASWVMAQQPDLQYYRGWNKESINIFEPSKTDSVPYTGFKIRIGGSFTQDFQSLKSENKANYVAVGKVNATDTDKRNRNILYGVATSSGSGASAKFLLNTPGDSASTTLTGFNLAMANLNLDFQIADGIRVCLENYMSARHHSEFWVKGGYIQIDKLPMLGNPKWFEKYLRVKIGHFQPNVGDMQFRRSDGGNTLFNPFMENYILDAFSTEIGGEVYVFPVDGFMGMVGMTSGFINGNIDNYSDTIIGNANRLLMDTEVTKKNPSIFFKLAFDKQITTDFRFRLSASMYNNNNSARNTLYAGDRTGSHYFMAMEPALQVADANGIATASASAQAAQKDSGRFNPNFSNKVNTLMFNTFVKFMGAELFGTYEQAKGGTFRGWDKSDRKFTQLAGELIFRFFPHEQAYVGARYVQAKGRPQDIIDTRTGAPVIAFTKDISIDRLSLAAGWFPTKNMLLKGEYTVAQNYKDFPTNDYRNEGKFSGFMIEAVIGF